LRPLRGLEIVLVLLGSHGFAVGYRLAPLRG